MIFELMGVLFAGGTAGLLFWAVNRALKGRLPSWLMPVSAGAAMLVATISSEYGWFERTRATMPEGMVVAEAIDAPSFYRPWTYLVPFVTRFVAVDQATIRTHPDRPAERIVELVFYGRWQRPAKVPVLFDCAGPRRADIVDGIEFGPDGEVVGVEWREVAPDAPVLRAACAEV
jgi:hypothetical protein